MTGAGGAPDAGQREVVDFLTSGRATGRDLEVETLRTHISVVFLAADRAFKLKRAVRFPYLDFSTLAAREAACRAEVAVNRRTAPDLYLGVAPVVRAPDGGLALGEPDEEPGGEVVDWLVVMRRFDQAAMLDRLAGRGALTPEIVRALAEEIADFHATAEIRAERGGAAAMRRVVEGNLAEIAGHSPETFDPARVETLAAQTRSALETVSDLLDRRRRDGKVRHCHGDLHLRNICLIDGRPTLFDAIEFSDEIAEIDVLYDLAFLLMDLEHRGLRPLANLALNHYLGITGDAGGLAALPLFLSARASVRAHVTAAAGGSAEARAYLDLAAALLEAAPARLIAIGGLSGTGKTTVALALAPPLGTAPGAIVLRSDMIRKRLMGVAPATRLDASGYTSEVTRRVYATIQDEARAALSAGYVAIADAVYAKEEEREALAAVAARAGVPFDGLWLDAGTAARVERVSARRGDASDADAEIVRSQDGLVAGAISWRRVDAGGDPAGTVAACREVVAPHAQNR